MPDDRARASCPECATPLDLHQPDEELADRLLGTCGGCRAWFLLDGLGGAMVRVSWKIDPAGGASP